MKDFNTYDLQQFQHTLDFAYPDPGLDKKKSINWFRDDKALKQQQVLVGELDNMQVVAIDRLNARGNRNFDNQFKQSVSLRRTLLRAALEEMGRFDPKQIADDGIFDEDKCLDRALEELKNEYRPGDKSSISPQFKGLIEEELASRKRQTGNEKENDWCVPDVPLTKYEVGKVLDDVRAATGISEDDVVVFSPPKDGSKPLFSSSEFPVVYVNPVKYDGTVVKEALVKTEPFAKIAATLKSFKLNDMKMSYNNYKGNVIQLNELPENKQESKGRTLADKLKSGLRVLLERLAFAVKYFVDLWELHALLQNANKKGGGGSKKIHDVTSLLIALNDDSNKPRKGHRPGDSRYMKAQANAMVTELNWLRQNPDASFDEWERHLKEVSCHQMFLGGQGSTRKNEDLFAVMKVLAKDAVTVKGADFPSVVPDFKDIYDSFAKDPKIRSIHGRKSKPVTYDTDAMDVEKRKDGGADDPGEPGKRRLSESERKDRINKSIRNYRQEQEEKKKLEEEKKKKVGETQNDDVPKPVEGSMPKKKAKKRVKFATGFAQIVESENKG